MSLDRPSSTWPDLAMKRVKIAERKDHLSEHLRLERGGQLLVTDRDRPIARIEPVARSWSLVRMKAPKRPFASCRAKRYPPARWKIRSLTLLLEERRDR
jgi:antitoxin (DNA-binding transcriptional repressor) of toxin-antitoxin stability system